MRSDYRPGPPYVVVVLGRPASGKTTISAAIAQRWSLPIVSKDALKETLFDTLGVGDRAWSARLGRAAFALLDRVIELQLQSGRPFLVDAAYNAAHENEKFQAWQRQFGFTAVQVHCTSPRDVMIERFTRRASDGSRHAGHADQQSVDEFEATLSDGRQEVLDIEGTVLRHHSDVAGGDQRLLRALDAVLTPLSGRDPSL
ncbi:MAG TPA: ATP-binding protein [Naasia sp.]|jgi:predicted kinase